MTGTMTTKAIKDEESGRKPARARHASASLTSSRASRSRKSGRGASVVISGWPAA